MVLFLCWIVGRVKFIDVFYKQVMNEMSHLKIFKILFQKKKNIDYISQSAQAALMKIP